MKNELEIRQHNALTNARYDYAELQLDLLFFIISRLRKEQKTSLYELPIRELSILTGKKYDLPYLCHHGQRIEQRLHLVGFGTLESGGHLVAAPDFYSSIKNYCF